MRVMIGVTLLLAACRGAIAQTEAPMPLAAPVATPVAPPTAPSLNEEERARQDALETRIAARTRRAMGSICQGCRGAAARPARSRLAPGGDELPVADPAQAPLD